MTQEQQLASDPNRSVWVSASAGTGKTKILTDRVLRLLLAGAPPGSILCMTFTKAAAAEMLERIEHRLAIWAVADDEALRTSLQQLTEQAVDDSLLARARQLFALVLDAPEQLRVQTIHSFCQSVIARFPLEAGVSPHATLLEERDAQEILEQSRLRIFEDSSHHPEGREATLLRTLAQMLSESTLRDLLERVISAREEFAPWLDMQAAEERFLSRIHEKLNMPVGTTERSLLQQYFGYRPEEKDALRVSCRQLVDSASLSDRRMGERMALWLEENADVAAYASLFLTDKGEPRKKLVTKEISQPFPDTVTLLEREQERVLAYMEASKTLQLIHSSSLLLQLARVLFSHYRAEKLRRGVMDYNDLIAHTVHLLKRSDAAAWVLFKLDGNIEHLLVDEAQDTSPQQWQIVEALVEEFFAGEGACTRNRTLFVVGDEKQSIFSFQGAEPRTFDAMRLHLSKRAQDAGALFSHVRLGLSFRSTEAVLSAVDTVFALPAAREGLVFSETDFSHKAHRSGQAGKVEIWPLIEAEKREKSTIWERMEEQALLPSPEQLMAQRIAGEIEGWLQQKRLLPAQGRPVEPGDIMILVRKRGAFGPAMLRELKRRRIPVAGADRLVVTKHIAVMDCMALGDFLLLPEDDYALACVLKSPLLGLSEEDLFALSHGRGKVSLWRRLKENPAYAEAREFLSDMLARVDYMPPYELYSHMLVTCGKRKAMIGRLGHEADDPLNEFLNLCMQYELGHPASLQGFLHWLRSCETDIKRDMEQGRNEVRILTVHASKGLQAPVVFLPDTTSVPRHPSGLQWMEGEPPLPCWSPASKRDNALMQTLKQAAKDEDLREYRRLLYVAMTRAEDELYIGGWKGGKAMPEGCWYDLIHTALCGSEGWQEIEGGWVLSTGGAGDVRRSADVVETASVTLPTWMHLPPPVEPAPSRPLSPSRIEAQRSPAVVSASSVAARAKGVLTHRLLQYLPQFPRLQWENVMERFIAHYGAELSVREKSELSRQVMAVLDHPDYSGLFGEHSLAEVPIVGVVEDETGQPLTIAGQIDRLLVQEEKVYIVDFKTGEEVPKQSSLVPLTYRKQMQAYRRLVSKLYPDKQVHCVIIWTSLPLLMELEDECVV